MKFRILSDTHLDYNYSYPFELSGDPEVFTLIAGDVSGDPQVRKEWLQEQTKRGYRGAFVEGNHVVYHNTQKTLDEIYSDLKKDFPRDLNGFTFLENDCILFEDGVLLIGCTLWTDFDLYHNQVVSMNLASHYMNDYRFKCIKTLPEEEYTRGAKSRWNDGVRNLKPEDTIGFFTNSMEYIENVLKKYSGRYRSVVLLTHHAPSQASIASQYSGSDTNPAYASRLADFILDHPYIELWVHGHIHAQKDYMIGDTRVICNPRGYVRYYEDANFNPDLIVEV